MTHLLARCRAFVKTLQDNLTDLHDPAGVHWHRAVNATIAGGIAALLLFWNPVLVQPLAVISALIFSHTNKGSQLSQQRRSQGIALGISLISIALLTLVHSLALAHGIIMILLSFLAEYATKWGTEYGFKFVLILALVATRGEDLSGKIPLVLLNVGIGFSLAYGLSCQCFPYRFQRAGKILSQKIDRRLAELLAKITAGQNTHFLKRRLFSLLQTQVESLTQFSSSTTEEALQFFSTQVSLFEALIILERSLILVAERPDLQYLNHIMAVKSQGEIPSLFPVINTTVEVQHAVQALVTILEGKPSSGSLSLPPKPKKTPPQFWDFHDAIAHQAFRSAIAVALALIIAYGFHLPHRDWIVISALIVNQEAVGDTLRKSYGRIWGSVLGLMATLVLVAIAFQYHSVVLALAFLTIFPYLYLRPSLNHYGYAKFFQQIAVICFLVLIGERANLELIEWRIGNIVLGCVIGQGVSLFVFPRWSKDRWKTALMQALTDCQTLFQAIAQAEQSGHWETDSLATLSYQAGCSVYQMDYSLESRQQELKLKGEPINLRWQLIQVNRVLYEAILYWGFTVKTALIRENTPALTADEIQLIDHIDQAFTLLQNSIGFQVSLAQPLIPEAAESLVALRAVAEAIADYALVKNRYTYPKS